MSCCKDLELYNDCRKCHGTGRIQIFTKRGKIKSDLKCEDCVGNGFILTFEGQHLLNLLRKLNVREDYGGL